jgi:hypothetical protein
MLAKVRDKKTNVERTVSLKAYELIKHRYVLLGYLTDDGLPSEGPLRSVQQNSVQNSVQKKRDVEPVADKPKLTREDLDRMNKEAMDKAIAKIEAEKAKQSATPGLFTNESKKSPIPPSKKYSELKNK